MNRGSDDVQLLLTEHALQDLAEIQEYSLAKWGERQADKYLDDMESALSRIQERPDLLRPETQFSPFLSFYRVNKHLLVCDRVESTIYLLAVIHGNRDIPSRLSELTPSLAAEVELLREKLAKKR